MSIHSFVVVGSTVVVCTALVTLTGCGGSQGTGPASDANHSSAELEIGNTINYGSFGTNAEVDCADGKSLNVGGSNNTLTVTGTCNSVNVAGADNKIIIDVVDKSLIISGLNNTISYSGGAPTVDDHGSGNTVKKG